MNRELTLVVVVVLGLADWRLASMVANEDGPFYIFRRFRAFADRLEARSRLLQALHFCEGLTCEWCNSMWFGSVLVLFWLCFGEPVVYLSLILALSTITVVIKFVVQTLEAAKNDLENPKIVVNSINPEVMR